MIITTVLDEHRRYSFHVAAVPRIGEIVQISDLDEKVAVIGRVTQVLHEYTMESARESEIIVRVDSKLL